MSLRWRTEKQKQVSEQSEPSSLQSIRPPRDDRAAWLAYWQEQNQLWRTEPEIRLERRTELGKRRALVPDVEKGIYPFKGMELERADVEWLLATHDGGPVKWSDETERGREGLDVRGADLQHANLHQLPLTRLRGGLTFDEWSKATEEQRSSAVVLMRGAKLSEVQLEGANLSGAQLEGADLYRARLKGAYLSRAQLEGADLRDAQLEGANLSRAQLKGANLHGAQLEGANLRNAILGDKQRIGPQLADVQWGDTNLAVVDWAQVAVLGDEHEARQKKTPDGKKKEQAERLSEYQAAVRANRQLAVAYRAQRLQRIVLRRQRKVVAYVFSGVLDLLGDTYARLAAAEAVVGLLIEISFIATFTQRFFGK